jgi:hypothetical protein
MIDNYSYKIFDVFYVMSSFLANFYDDEHFMIAYFVISLDEDYFFEVKNNQSSLITNFCELWKDSRYDKIKKHLFSLLIHHRVHNDVTLTRSWRFFLLISWIFSSLKSWRIWFWIFFFHFLLTKRLILRSF